MKANEAMCVQAYVGLVKDKPSFPNDCAHAVEAMDITVGARSYWWD